MEIPCPWGEGWPVAWHSAWLSPSWDIRLELNTGHAWMSAQWKVSGDTWDSSRPYHSWGICTALAPPPTKAILIQWAKVRESLLTRILWDFHSAGAFGSTYQLALSTSNLLYIVVYVREYHGYVLSALYTATLDTIHTKVAVTTTDRMAYHGLDAFSISQNVFSVCYRQQ